MISQFSAGTARITPNAEPCDRIAIGIVRFSSGNHLKMACAATDAAGPSPAPRMTRQIRSVVKPTVPTIGNCASAQTSARTRSTHRVSTRLTMKPTTIAAIENSKKNEEPSRPNASGSSLSSVMIGTPARPTTILSAKFTTMNRNRRKVIFQAPLGVSLGVGSAFMIGSRIVFAGSVGRPGQMLPMASPARQQRILTGPIRRPTLARDTRHRHRMATIVLSVTGLTKSYRSGSEAIAVLRGVNLAVAEGESVALTGESGSGKSTLLHLIAGLDAADAGEISLADALVSKLGDARRAELRRDRLGLVFQQFNLIPSLTVEDNLAFQSRIAGRHDVAWHGELVERLGLGHLLTRYPEQLSGGQQQRVAIGRALAAKPLLLLADEPTGNLDEATADEVLALARDLVARTGCGFLMVTHSARLAATLDRQVNLHAGLVA